MIISKRSDLRERPYKAVKTLKDKRFIREVINTSVLATRKNRENTQTSIQNASILYLKRLNLGKFVITEFVIKGPDI